jgi:hypothetical protein
MRWLWNNNVVLIYSGAGLIGLGFVFAVFALLGLASIFRVFALGSLSAGIISILCSLIILSLQFGVRSSPKKVIGFSLATQGLMAISFFFLHSRVDYYSRLYSPWIGLILGGLGFVSIEMATLLLLIGLIRLFFYNPRPS